MLTLNWIDDDDPLPPTRAGAGARQRRARPAGRRRRADAASAWTRPTARASSPGTATASRCCGGRPTRAWCCRWTSSSSRARCARRLRRFIRDAGLRSAHRQRLRPRHRGLRQHAARRPGRHLDRAARWSSAYSAWHRRGAVHSVETWIDGATGRRALRRGHRPHVLRRVDVLAPHRCVEDRAGRAGVLLPRARHRADRLPAEHARTWRRWARARSPRSEFEAPPGPHAWGSRRSPIGPMIPRMWAAARVADWPAPRPPEDAGA